MSPRSGPCGRVPITLAAFPLWIAMLIHRVRNEPALWINLTSSIDVNVLYLACNAGPLRYLFIYKQNTLNYSLFSAVGVLRQMMMPLKI
jgi:hypothetical protein